MSEEIELKLLKEIEELKQEIKALKGEQTESLPIYNYSKMDFKDLERLFSVKKNFSDEPFQDWFNYDIEISDNDIEFLKILLSKYGKFIKSYKKETLKANFIIPIIKKVDFLSIEHEISNFYEEVITYQTGRFILSGVTDFVVSKGLEFSKKPYFFIQEFKKSKENSDPEPQLVAELITGITLNNFKTITNIDKGKN
ncbi:MAG: hypothetical protein H7A23_07885 [Leptospiraceae bacterium]|nr:hypothetical protein [Leptospiraceae bacterium]MCP5494463.1 hypothetical protein [Leptospiraceae bacterium]